MDSSNLFPVGYSDGDVDTNRSGNPTFASVVGERYSRRQTLFGGVAALTMATFSTGLLAACDDGNGNSDVTVDAGQDAQTSAGRVVVLSGTTDGDPNSAEWEQVSGPEVAMTNADTGTASFIAPSVEESTPLVFRFTAADGRGREVSDESTVTVTPARLGFDAVSKSLEDKVIVPAGYSVTVLYRLGDPIKASVPAYANNGGDSGFDGRAGDHHDALFYYGLSAGGDRDDANSNRGLLVMNHENITQDFLHPNGPSPAPRPESEALKEMEAQGVSVVEVARDAAGGWSYVQGSALNRRVTPLTETELRGPAAGSDQMRTRFSPEGTRGRGTINNCANGYTPWGTNLTCEENWAFYFRRDDGDDAARTAAEVTALGRYGVSAGNGGNFAWTTVQPADPSTTAYSRWNATLDPAAADATGDFRNEPNQFGWVVEIDPYDPSKAPRKRTALGRLGHEGCWPGLFSDGARPAFYMGDDGRGEYIYKFVSAAAWSAGDARADDRLAIGDKYLDRGTLYVARFNADGTGEWRPLIFGRGPLTPANAAYPFRDQADVLIHARLAADALGATRMDRPEWSATNPVTGEIYFTLTNNSASGRPLNGTDAANPRHYNDPTTDGEDQRGNPNGHILRLREANGSGEATSFAWDVYAFGAGADLDAGNVNLSALDASNDFSSPDGLWFSRATNAAGKVNPLLWIQTDDGAYTDVSNCMMLAAQPGQVGDGGPVTITNVGADGAMAAQSTIVGAAPGTNLRRFLVGPKGCEITGIDSTPDGRALFVNIQHPGDDGTGHWPDTQADSGATSRPRSATIVITKDDGGVVGL